MAETTIPEVYPLPPDLELVGQVGFLGVHPVTKNLLTICCSAEYNGFIDDEDDDDYALAFAQVFSQNPVTKHWKRIFDFAANVHDLVPAQYWAPLNVERRGINICRPRLSTDGNKLGLLWYVVKENQDEEEFLGCFFLLAKLDEPEASFEIFVFRPDHSKPFEKLCYSKGLDAWICNEEDEKIFWRIDLHDSDEGPKEASLTQLCSISDPSRLLSGSSHAVCDSCFAACTSGQRSPDTFDVEVFDFKEETWKRYPVYGDPELIRILQLRRFQVHHMGNDRLLCDATISMHHMNAFPGFEPQIPGMRPIYRCPYLKLTRNDVDSCYMLERAGHWYLPLEKLHYRGKELSLENPREADCFMHQYSEGWMLIKVCHGRTFSSYGYTMLNIESSVDSLQFLAAKAVSRSFLGINEVSPEDIGEKLGLPKSVVKKFFI